MPNRELSTRRSPCGVEPLEARRLMSWAGLDAGATRLPTRAIALAAKAQPTPPTATTIANVNPSIK